MVIEIKRLEFEFEVFDEKEKPNKVLHGIDVEIKPGEFVAIIGHNGSGKSTLAKHLNALLTPTKGDVWINGKNTRDIADIWTIRQKVGMLFQNPENQIIASVVEEDVAFGPENLGVSPENIRERVAAALATVGMADCAKRAPHTLSGGQKQRVGIAGVLAMQSACIVLDEPTAMLDPVGRKEVIETITTLNKNMGTTIVLVTHFMEEVVVADRIIVMDAGKIAMDDTPRNVFARMAELEAIGLTVPHVTSLACKMQTVLGCKFSQTIISVDEFLEEEIVKIFAQIYATGIKNIDGAKKEMECITGKTWQSECNMPDATHTHLTIKNLVHVYNPGTVFEKKALDDVSLDVKRGEIVAIIGHTGSGKSTLIQHLNALQKPTSGTVLLNGEDIFEKKSNVAAVRHEVGLVFQYPEHQLFETTVYKDVAFGPIQKGVTGDELDQVVVESLAMVGITRELFDKSPFELSGGQMRRVAIAGVLAMRPQVLVLDEPAAGLDPRGRDEIFDQIRHMHTSLGITVVLVSHSMDDVAHIADTVHVIEEGKIVLHGVPAAVFSNKTKLESIGLGIPQICQIFHGMNKINPDIPLDILTQEAALEIFARFIKGETL